MTISRVFTDNIAIDGSFTIFAPDYKLDNDLYYISCSGRDDLLRIFNIILQYRYKIGERITPYIGGGYSLGIGKVNPFNIGQTKGSIETGNAGSLIVQLGVGLKVFDGFYFNLDFKHALPTTHDLIVTLSGFEIGRSRYQISSRSDLTFGIIFEI